MPTNSLYPEMTATPRNKLAGLLADALTGVRDFADQVKVPEAVPLLGGQGVGSMFLGQAPEEVNELSYGNLPIQINPYAGRTASYAPEMKRGRGAQVFDAISLLSLPGAKTVAGGLLGMPGADAAMFIGSKAKTWDAAAAARAIELEKAGVPAPSIWSQTGTLRGPDGLLRQEIDDSGALFNTSTINGIKRENDLVGVGSNFDYGPINGFLDHGPLKEAYGTDLTNSTFIGNKNTLLGDGVHGSYDPHAGSITINAPAKAADARSTMLHELQHAIQQREGFAKGGFPGSFATQTFWSEPTLHNAKWAVNESRKTGTPLDEVVKQKNLGQSVLEAAQRPDLARLHEDAILAKAPFKSYQRLAGEAEARATEARMNMTPAERRATFPFDSYDVPVNQLIIR